MDIQATKIELIKAILAIENIEVIQKLKDFLNTEKVDFFDKLTTQEKEEIAKGIEQLNAGKRVSFKDVLAKIS